MLITVGDFLNRSWKHNYVTKSRHNSRNYHEKNIYPHICWYGI